MTVKPLRVERDIAAVKTKTGVVSSWLIRSSLVAREGLGCYARPGALVKSGLASVTRREAHSSQVERRRS